MFNKIIIIYTTVASLQQAETLAEKVIVGKLAACANIIPGALSIYEWQGRLEKTTEYLIIFKTALSKAELLYKWLLNNHPYSVPAIIKILADTSKGFSDYVNAQT